MTPPPRPGAVIAAHPLSLPAADAFALVTDVRHHADWIPLTRVDVDGPLHVGSRFRAVSGPGARDGAPGLVDSMRVTRLDPPADGHPGVAHFVREGPVMHGWAHIVVRDEPGGGSLVVWAEEAALVGPLPRALTARLIGPALALVIRVALRGAARSAHA
ncbi:SRPBCC family protein [Cellulomonas alba]|uniref:SRPBCC family protein n=1 Tax=Cellulomonas alba TaxID=3053467 RepID=A0ABT7SH21_9CELL|nr:SRPBCC family protein [Cellulomonas alba]MDM7855476.1 SRPBCC family protein [Cellulomonas alba]